MRTERVVHILLVDDDKHILKGLRRNLMVAAPTWKVSCANSVVEAFSSLKKDPVDIIISDLRMPMVDGADFLLQVQQEFPQTIRFVLSGQASEELMIKSSTAVHRYFTKPCNIESLVNAIHEVVGSSQILSDEKVKGLVVNLGQLPPMPSLYASLLSTLRDPNSNMRDIAKVISQDPPMVSKIMQVANSAYFGAMGNISDLDSAILLLGIDIIKGFVLVGKIFEGSSPKGKGDKFTRQLWVHSTQASLIAHSIILKHTGKREWADEAFTMALLHDIGKLILSEAFGNGYKEVLHTSQSKGIPLYEVEKNAYGNCHGEVGSHLLNLWGLPPSIPKVLRFHHMLSSPQETELTPLISVHIANALAHAREVDSPMYTNGPLDSSFLENIGLSGELDYWQKLSEKEGSL